MAGYYYGPPEELRGSRMPTKNCRIMTREEFFYPVKIRLLQRKHILSFVN